MESSLSTNPCLTNVGGNLGPSCSRHVVNLFRGKSYKRSWDMNNFTEVVLKQKFPWDLEEVELYVLHNNCGKRTRQRRTRKLLILPGGRLGTESFVCSFFMFSLGKGRNKIYFTFDFTILVSLIEVMLKLIVTLTFDSLDEILSCLHWNETSLTELRSSSIKS